MISSCVVDASVGIKLFVIEEHTDAAERLFNQLAVKPSSRFYVPDLFFVECANILWKYVRRFDYPIENARQDVADLASLALMPVSTADLLPDALDIALAYGLTAYDASYAALARQLRLPLVTADAPLTRKLQGSGIVCHSLAEL